MLQWFIKLARTIAKSIGPRRTAASTTRQPIRHTTPRPEVTEDRPAKSSLPRPARQQKTAAQPHQQRPEAALAATEHKNGRQPAELSAVDTTPPSPLVHDGPGDSVIAPAVAPKSSSTLAIEPQPHQHQRPEICQPSAPSAPDQAELTNPEPIPHPSPLSDLTDLGPAEHRNSAQEPADDLAENADGDPAAAIASPATDASIAPANDIAPAFCEHPATAQNDPPSLTEIGPEINGAPAVAAASEAHLASPALDPAPASGTPAVPIQDAEQAISGETATAAIELPCTRRRDEYPLSANSGLSGPASYSALDGAAMLEPLAIPSDAATVLPSAPSQPQPLGKRRTAVHRDRRGLRRAAEAQKAAPSDQAGAPQRRPSDLRLRLELDRRSQTAMLSAVVTRGEGFPDTVAVGANDSEPLPAFNERRYDDVPLDWSGELLRTEIRLRDEARGFSWLHSARTVHIFTDEPGEPDLLTVAAAITGRRHALIVPADIASHILALTGLAGSPQPEILAGWRGIPQGWTVLDGYVPVKAIEQELVSELKPIDPGIAVTIAFAGGMRVRGNAWAEGSPPEIRIDPVPANASVTIGARVAEQHADGRWTAPGHEAPGTHIVDVVPGPSASYTILPDPARTAEWPLAPTEQPSTTRIYGASAIGANNRPVLALASPGSVTAIGARGGIHIFAQRQGYGLSSGSPPFEPDFLLVSWGQRRTHGRIVWLGRPLCGSVIAACGRWTAAVRTAAARQLPVVPDTPEARQAWQLTVKAARHPAKQGAS